MNCTKLLKETAQDLLFRHVNINVPLILKMRDIFLREIYIMGHFKGYFGGRDNLGAKKV
jgi:hypothetical protein